MTILLAIIIFGILIFVHEMGHYIFARIFDVEISEFAIGMGPRLISKKSKKTGIIYSLRLLPIGGFVSMVGENEEIKDNPRAFNNKKGWQKLIITLAGAAVNILIGFIIMSIYTLSMPKYGGTQIAQFNEGATSNEVLQIGDTIKSVNGVNVYTASDLFYRVSMDGYKTVEIKVERDGEIKTFDVTFASQEEENITFGACDFRIYEIEKNFTNTLKASFAQCRLSVMMVFDSIGGLITGRFAINNMSGVVGTTEIISETAKTGISNLLYLCAIISVNLGIFNLLPIPALDGGHNVFHIIEIFRGKPINQKAESMIHGIGMLLLLLLVAFVTINDIIKIFV